MRFFTFLKDYRTSVDGMKDGEVVTFAEWIYSDGLPKKNPHASPNQIKIYLHYNNASDTVKIGFFKTLDAYNKELAEENS